MDPADRRRRVLTLTDTGSATGLAADAEGIEDDFLASRTSGDRRELGRILCDLRAALNPTVGDHGSADGGTDLLGQASQAPRGWDDAVAAEIARAP